MSESLTEFVQLQVPRALGYGFPPDEIYLHDSTGLDWYLKRIHFSGVYVIPRDRCFTGMSRYAREDRPYNWTKCENVEVTNKFDNSEWYISADGIKYRVIGFKDCGINDSATWCEECFCSLTGVWSLGQKMSTIKHEYKQYTMVVEKYKEKHI